MEALKLTETEERYLACLQLRKAIKRVEKNADMDLTPE